MFEPTVLTPSALRIAENTISANAFFLIAQSYLMQRRSLSVVRMGDGELSLWKEAAAALGKGADGLGPVEFGAEKWRRNLGIEGISHQEIYSRLNAAANRADYFAPSISGLVNPHFDLYSCFPMRSRYVDIFFPNAWSEEMITQLYREARHVVLIHRNPDTARAFQERAPKYLGVEVTWVRYEKWEETEEMIERVSEMQAPLVIASVGPAGKYAIPQIAEGGRRRVNQKVVLDIGNTIDRFILYETWQQALKQETVIA